MEENKVQDENGFWIDLKAMYKSIKEHPHKVEQNDDIENNHFGYKSIGDNTFWKLNLKHIQDNLTEEQDNIKNFIPLLSTEDGKQKILEKLNENK